jgi:1-deoxy-D-xylulose 5-phosphate reductoisomerase
MDITRVVAKMLDTYKSIINNPTLEDIINTDSEVRVQTEEIINRMR